MSLDKVFDLLKSKSQVLVTVGVIVLFLGGIWGVTQLEAFFKGWLGYETALEHDKSQAELKSEMKDMIREENRQLLNDFESRFHGRRRASVEPAAEEAAEINSLAEATHFERPIIE